MPKFTISFSILLLFTACIAAKGDVVITATEVSGNTIFSAEGTLDLSALTFVSGGSATAFLNPDSAAITTGAEPTTFLPADFYNGFSSSPLSFGNGTYTGGVVLDGTGDRFGIMFFSDESHLVVPDGYTGGSISGTVTFEGDFEALGVVPGSYSWEWGSGSTADSITLNVVAVPEPSSTALLAAIGFAAITVRKRIKFGH